MQKVKTKSILFSPVQVKQLVNQKVAVGIMMAAASVLAFTFAATIIRPSILEDGNLEVIRRPRVVITPLRPGLITNAQTNVLMPTPSSTSQVILGFVRGEDINTMGTLELSSNYFGPGVSVNGGTWPLQIQLRSTIGMSSSTVPNSVISISTDRGDFSLCLSSTSLQQGEKKSYFYDTNGTPYLDSLLRQPAMNTPCNQILAKGLKIINISSATTNIANTAQVSAAFFRGVGPEYMLGHMSLYDNFYQPTRSVNDSSAPLEVKLGTLDPASVTNSIITISDFDSHSYNLCIPATTLGAAQEKSYFYDTNGTPYLDSLLTEKVTCYPVRSAPQYNAAP
ncbi:MAG: hypothetical protein C3F02_03155 [Parcubacteria group bacterium]|nr:MAG: hypothetical protein C3F02_03155 [Parcubacteria group bacterium]